MSKNSAEEDEFDELEEVDDEHENVDDRESVTDSFDARRHLEKILEDKALERLINGDFYDY